MRNIKSIAIAAAAAAATVSSAHAGVVFTDSFESLTPNNWRVYQSVGDQNSWVNVDGAGIEIQNANVGDRSAADGDFYVELASDTKRGGIAGESPNSMMASLVDLVAGQQYKVSFAYRPRTNKTNDNGIELSVGNLFGDQYTADDVLVSVSRTAAQQPGWEYISVVFTAMAGQNSIAFRAFGRNNTLGGFIDDVTVSAVPVPGAALLFAAGLGVVSMTRRKSAM